MYCLALETYSVMSYVLDKNILLLYKMKKDQQHQRVFVEVLKNIIFQTQIAPLLRRPLV